MVRYFSSSRRFLWGRNVDLGEVDRHLVRVRYLIPCFLIAQVDNGRSKTQTYQAKTLWSIGARHESFAPRIFFSLSLKKNGRVRVELWFWFDLLCRYFIPLRQKLTNLQINSDVKYCIYSTEPQQDFIRDLSIFHVYINIFNFNVAFMFLMSVFQNWKSWLLRWAIGVVCIGELSATCIGLFIQFSLGSFRYHTSSRKLEEILTLVELNNV